MLNEIKFYSIGDFGYPSPEIKRVSDAMNLYSEINGEPNFILGLGDNFYPCGVDSINDNQFQNSWENIFLKHRKLRVPWYISKFKSLFFILEFIFIVYFYYHSHLLTYLPTYFYLYSSNCELVLGNHDYMGIPEAQIKFTQSKKNPDGLWNLPNEYYNLSFKNEDLTVDLFGIDTNGKIITIII